MDKEKAAGYFLLAWIKEWSMPTLAGIILESGSGHIDPEYLNKNYSFMPQNRDCYFLPARRGGFSPMYVRKFVADNYPKLNARLWDCNSNEEIMSLKDRVLRLDCPNILAKTKFSKNDKIKNNKIMANGRAEQKSYEISREIFKKSRGTDWNTVK